MKSSTTGRVGRLAAALLVSGGCVTLGAGSASASAPTCSPSHCTGQDPVRTNCYIGAYIVLQETAFDSTANMWWSPACLANWVQYLVPDSVGYQYQIVVYGSFGPSESESVDTSIPGWAYTDMVYSPGAASMCITSTPALNGEGCWTQS